LLDADDVLVVVAGLTARVCRHSNRDRVLAVIPLQLVVAAIPAAVRSQSDVDHAVNSGIRGFKSATQHFPGTRRSPNSRSATRFERALVSDRVRAIK
jgi:hypothetical protein